MKTAEELYKLVNKESDDWLEEMIKEKMKDKEFFITLSEVDFFNLATSKFKDTPTKESVHSFKKYLKEIGYMVEVESKLVYGCYIGDTYYYISWRQPSVKKWLELLSQIKTLKNEKDTLERKIENCRTSENNLQRTNYLLENENEELKKHLESMNPSLRKWFR